MNRHTRSSYRRCSSYASMKSSSEVPAGMVASYGDIAAIVGGGCDARMVGYALNAIPKAGAEEIPWQRIVNAQGGISTKGLLQRKLLEDEGIVFDLTPNRLPLSLVGPDDEWAGEWLFRACASLQQNPANNFRFSD